MFNAIRNLVLLMGRELNYSVQQRKNFERQNGGKGTSKMKKVRLVKFHSSMVFNKVVSGGRKN